MAEKRLLAVSKQLALTLRDALRLELTSQKHVASAKLLNSIQVTAFESVGAIVIEGSFFDYGLFLDTGRKAGGKKVPIAALEEWIRIKGFATNAKKIKGIAFAIQTTIFKEGSPTKGSAFLATKRTGWLTDVLDRSEQKLGDDIEKGTVEELDFIFDELVRNANRELRK